MQESAIPIRHHRNIEVDLNDTQAVLDQLMVDAAIRVVSDIR